MGICHFPNSRGCGCGPTPPCRPSSLNDCYHEIAQCYGCPFKVVSGGQIGVEPLGRIAFSVEPSQSNYFLPVAVRLSARLRDDPSQLLVWRLTAVVVKNVPQENYHDPNPGVDTVTGVESVAYDGRTAGEVPAFEVGWDPFSRRALADHLERVGVGRRLRWDWIRTIGGGRGPHHRSPPGLPAPYQSQLLCRLR